MAVSNISTNGPNTQSPVTKVSGKTLGKEDFLNLLVTQMKNQDPLNPMDNSQFASQLAQFSSLEQLQNVNDNLKSMQSGQIIWQKAQAVNYIGKSVEASNKTFSLAAGGSTKLTYSLQAPASYVSVGIYAQDGSLVRTIETKGGAAGKYQIDWNGLDSKGKMVPGGLYSFDVVALDAKKNQVPTGTYLQGKVTGIMMQGEDTQLMVGNTPIPLSSVLKVLSE